MNDASLSLTQALISIPVMAVILFLLRILPFAFFSKKEPPPVLTYIGKHLPPLVMTVLLIYNLRNIELQIAPYGMAEILASLFTVIMHLWRKNAMISIFGGTILYKCEVKMQYRIFPKIQDKQISVLGFGLMRLPVLEGEGAFSKNIDIDATKKLVQEALNQGINYFDTAYIYHEGNSEVVLGKIVNELGIREKIYIADKMPMWLVKEEEDLERLFNEQLTRLDTDYIDFYLLHSLSDKTWELVKKVSAIKFLEQKKKEGKIRHIGFSFHHEFSTFKSIIDHYSGWEFCQIQYNYLDEDYQAGTSGLDYANAHEIGVISMEPLRGGLLANVPKPVIDIFSVAKKPRTPFEWAFRWVWDHQGIITALSGMGKLEEIISNCAIASSGKANSLPSSQISVIEKARDTIKASMKVPCTGCSYCIPCPTKVSIPEIFKEYNRLAMNGYLETGKDTKGLVHSELYSKLKYQEKASDKCVSCGKCVAVCPQKISIPKELAIIHSTLA